MTAPLDRQLEVASLSGEVDAVMRGIVTHLMELRRRRRRVALDDRRGVRVLHGLRRRATPSSQGQTLPLAETLGNECLLRGDLTVLRATTGPEVTRCLTPGAGAIVLAPIEYDGSGARRSSASAAPTRTPSTTPRSTRSRCSPRAASIALRNAELVERLAESERQLPRASRPGGGRRDRRRRPKDGSWTPTKPRRRSSGTPSTSSADAAASGRSGWRDRRALLHGEGRAEPRVPSARTGASSGSSAPRGSCSRRAHPRRRCAT